MFIIIPLSLIGISLVLLAIIVWRKWHFLKKLEPDAHQVGESFIHDLVPEAVEKAKLITWRVLWHHSMRAVEEILNGLRSIFTAIGHASGRLRFSVRSVRESVIERQKESVVIPSSEKQKVVVPLRNDDAEQRRLLKSEEQRLILDIAQDPKNVNLYVALGRVYTNLGDVSDAIESFKTASKLDPDDEKINKKLEYLLERKKKEEEDKKVEQEKIEQEKNE